MKAYTGYFYLFLLFLSGCGIATPLEEQSILIAINPDKKAQVIRNFGASDAWACQFVGKNWPLEKKERIADLLFSTEIDSAGNPEGIGLSLWRFNMGAGTAEQGSESDIRDEWRRAETFLNADGSYNWQKQEGQQWFLNAAKNRGVDQFVAFVNSPPVHLTKNGKGYSSPDNTANLKEESYDEFAGFMVDVIGHFNRKGISIDYISPVNEPQWNWDGPGQEGSSYRNHEIYKLVRELNNELEEAKLKTKIEIPEAGRITDLYQNDSLPERNHQLYDFFDPASELYVGDLPNVAQKVAAHSYFTTFPEANLKTYRNLLKENIDVVNPALEFWMSEYCILENNPVIKGGGRDLSIDPALYMAKVIHHDLTYANANAWHWWLGVSPYDYKDGLVYIDHNKLDGNIYESKMLWALGNYSRFVRPGMSRIHVDNSESDGILKTAFSNGEELVVVLVNSDSTDTSVELKINGQEKAYFDQYVTSNKKEENLKYFGSIDLTQEVILPARSVTTLVSSGH